MSSLASNTDPTGPLTADFSEIARSLFSAGGVHETLALVADVAVANVDGCDYAGIFVVVEGAITRPVRTDPLVTELDALQQDANEGPCLDAIASGTVFYSGNLGNDPRWPQFGPEARAKGVRSLLALPLTTDGTVGALNLYARYAEAFGVVDRARGLLLAALAALALSTAQTHVDDERRALNFRLALTTRELIGQAQGILMERERITADEAFDILRRASQHLNVKLREVAQTLVETGESPNTGPSRPS
ncbi:MAG: GAF and ANTAR domain-containing protein [Acidimicrobiales bacterium]